MRSTTENNESNESDNNEYNLSDSITCYFRITNNFKLEFLNINDVKYSCYPFDDLNLSIIEINTNDEDPEGHDPNTETIRINRLNTLITNEVYKSDDKIYSIEGYKFVL